MLSAFILAATLSAPGSVVLEESAPAVAVEFQTTGDAWLERVPVLTGNSQGHDGWHRTTPFVDVPGFVAGTGRGFLNDRGPLGDVFVIRGQNYDEDPQLSADLNQPPIILPPRGSTWGQPQTGWPGAGMLAPNGWPGGPAPNASVVGVNGPQPFRFGWQSRLDIGYMPSESVSRNGARGSLGVFETNLEMRYTAPVTGQWIFSVAPQFNLRNWDGPGRPQLHGDVYRFGSDFRLTSPTVGPTTVELGFTPALSSDFDRSPGSEAWSFDGYGALQIRTSPRWLVVIGALFWDRVNDNVLPYGGLVYTPNNVFEARLLFPRADVSMFLGAPWGVPQWLYVAGEYHIEAWQVSSPVPGGVQDRMEIEDWRILLGVRSESGGISSFLEAGWVLGRHADFQNTARDFDISSGFITRFGVRW